MSEQKSKSVEESAAFVGKLTSDENIGVSGKIFNAPSTIPKHRQETLKWNGWGYVDSRFSVDASKNIFLVFTPPPTWDHQQDH
jgi:hypothetical protein